MTRSALALLTFLAAAPTQSTGPDPSPEIRPRPPSAETIERYQAARQTLTRRRRRLRARYRRAVHRRQREAILDTAGDTVLTALRDTLLPAWKGTPWAFSGLARQPGAQPIACGTYVATVLKDAGFQLDRVAMGRLASEHIALSLTTNENVRRYSDRPISEVQDELRTWGPGLYMVGMDYHAGLVVVHPDLRISFEHSSVYPPGTVVSEPIIGDNPLSHSRYRVVARLLDSAMMRRWLLGQRFDTYQRPKPRERPAR